MIIAGLSNSKELAESVSRKLNVEYDDLSLRDSSEDELHVNFKSSVKGNKVVLVQSLYPYANHSLFEVLYSASVARDLGAREVIYVAPYMAFFREDNRKEKGECVQQKVVADLLSRNVDAVISVEPHLHQHNFSSKLFSIPFYGLKCGDLLRKYVRENFPKCSVIGFGDRGWKLAKHVDKNAALYNKEDSVDYGYDDVLLVDDILASGNTMLRNIKNLKARRINILAVHGLFSDNCVDKLKNSTNKIISCNTVVHETNKIDVSSLIAGKLMEL